MTWQQLQIKVTAESAELSGDLLLGLGASAITFCDACDQPVLEPEVGQTPMWEQAYLKALFPIEIDLETIIAQLKKINPSIIHDFQIEKVADKPWERVWLDHFEPQKFGETLWVTPETHCGTFPRKSNDKVVLLDPGLAFGTGTHATTALCLTWLESIVKPNMVIIDYGCGSGILAIAAVKLGAKRVYCVDNDPQALIATQENAKRNGLNKQQIDTYLPKDLPKIQADALVANILAKPLCGLVKCFYELLYDSGLIAISGILETQTGEIIENYEKFFQLKPIIQRESWILVEGIKSNI